MKKRPRQGNGPSISLVNTANPGAKSALSQQPTENHIKTVNYLQDIRNKREARLKAELDNKMTAQSNNVDDSVGYQANGRDVMDRGLRKVLQDPNLSEIDRLNAIRVRTDQIEQRALMQEQKIRLANQGGGSAT